MSSMRPALLRSGSGGPPVCSTISRRLCILASLLLLAICTTAVSAGSTTTTASSPQGSQSTQSSPSPQSSSSTQSSPSSSTVSPSLPSTTSTPSRAPTTFPTTTSGVPGAGGPASSPTSFFGSQQMTTSSSGGAGGAAVSGGLLVQLSGVLQGAAVSPSPQQFNSLAPQLAALAGRIAVSRVVAPTVQQASPGSGSQSVLRFTLLDGIPSMKAALSSLSNLVSSINVVLTITETNATFALSRAVVSWTASGPCPLSPCSSPGGQCDASPTTGLLSCTCASNYEGAQCAVYGGSSSNPLLALLVIPAVVVVGLVVLGAVLYWRHRRRERERKKPPADIALSTTNGVGFGTVSSEPGVRNMVYPTLSNKSYAIAFSDGVFNSAVEEEGGAEADKRATAMF